MARGKSFRKKKERRITCVLTATSTALIVALVMAILSPIMSELGVYVAAKDKAKYPADEGVM